MNDCLFCKIVAGEIPSSKVYEDEHTYAFLDINPTNIGHTLVIPKKHYENIYDLPQEDLHYVMSTVKKLALPIQTALKADGVNVIQNNGSAAGQIIFHSHTHIIPRFENDGFRHWPCERMYDDGEMDAVAEKIKNIYKNAPRGVLLFSHFLF
jgi:histidine triad (HIT) family protein